MEMHFDKLRQCRLFLLDMDGTLYLGDEVFPGAVDFVNSLPRNGRQYIYLTNNSSRAGADYVPRMQGLGFPCAAENVFTSGMATALWLRQQHPDARVYPVGTAAFRGELLRYGVTLTEDEKQTDVVVVGFDTELTYEKLFKAAWALRHGAAFIAANPDWVCPLPAGESMPDCGSICALLTASTGVQPHYIGKPNRGMVDVIARQTGIPPQEICCVGDRLYTDIAVGVNAGAVTALVLSGETDETALAGSEIQPDYVFRDVVELGRMLEARDAEL